MNAIFQETNKRFLAAQNILLATHRKPDGDACGSILALYLYLSSLGKNVAMFSPDPPPSYFGFLPAVELIGSDPSVFGRAWEVLAVLDAGDLDYAVVDESFVRNFGGTIINIDHHWSNKNFGHLNLVKDKASSVCEIIYSFFLAINFKIDKRIATCLLTGIMSDTGGFANAATNFSAVAASADLISRGGKLHEITENVVRNKSIDGLKLWGMILARLKINREWGVGYTYIFEDELKKYKVNEEEIDGLVNFLNVISDVSAALFLRINHQEVKVSMRTNKDQVDLSRLAGLFGGGGHKKAAGFTVPWKIKEENGRLMVV